MDYELMSEADYDGLPEEDEAKFLAIESTCRRNLNRLINEDSTTDFDELVRNQYMMMVASAAAELGVQGIEYPHDSDRPAIELGTFMVQVTGVVTRMRVRSSASKSGTVQVAAKTRIQLDVQIRRLRAIISSGEMRPEKRKALLERLDQLADEVAKSRLNLSRAMAMLAYVSIGVAAGTSFLADAPDAIATITSLIGIDQEAEAEERLRIGSPPPQKALPAPEHPRLPANAPAFKPGGMDDDIPF